MLKDHPPLQWGVQAFNVLGSKFERELSSSVCHGAQRDEKITYQPLILKRLTFLVLRIVRSTKDRYQEDPVQRESSGEERKN